MKFSLKTLASAVVTAVAASGASAAIQNGALGNGELFMNIWDANGSYTLDLNTTQSSFLGEIANPGNIHLTFAADPLLGQFFAGTSSAGTRTTNPTSGLRNFSFNLVANDSSGDRTIFTTFSGSVNPNPIIDTSMGAAVTAVDNFLNFANANIGANQSYTVAVGNTAYAGKSAFRQNIGNTINFSNAGGIANNSFATGLNFMSINGSATNGADPVAYNQFFDNGNAVRVYLDAANTLHIQAVPEPETYAMLLAGLGMLGFMARRRLNNRV